MAMLARASLPARFAFPDPLPHAAESAADCSLHRRISVAKGAVCSPKNAQPSPFIVTTENAAEDAAPCGAGDAKHGPIDEGRRGARLQRPRRG